MLLKPNNLISNFFFSYRPENWILKRENISNFFGIRKRVKIKKKKMHLGVRTKF